MGRTVYRQPVDYPTARSAQLLALQLTSSATDARSWIEHSIGSGSNPWNRTPRDHSACLTSVAHSVARIISRSGRIASERLYAVSSLAQKTECIAVRSTPWLGSRI